MQVVAVQNTGNGQLVTYKKPDSQKEESEEEQEEQKTRIRPAGQPYLTKINGRLVMARDRQDRPVKEGMHLLSHLFGGPRVVRSVGRRYNEQPEKQKQLVLTHAPSNVQAQPALLTSSSAQPQLPHTDMQQWNHQQLPSMAPQWSLTAWEIDQVRQINADFQTRAGDTILKNTPQLASPDPKNIRPSVETYNNTSITITKHICVNCGRLRSRKYHHENPIKPGEVPTPAFCAKCQKDVTSTEDSSSSDNYKKSHRRKRKSRDKKSKNKDKKKETESDEDNSNFKEHNTTSRDRSKSRTRREQDAGNRRDRNYRSNEWNNEEPDSFETSPKPRYTRDYISSRVRHVTPRQAPRWIDQSDFNSLHPSQQSEDDYVQENRRPREKIIYVERRREQYHSPSIERRYTDEFSEPSTSEPHHTSSVTHRYADEYSEPSNSEPLRHSKHTSDRRSKEVTETKCIEAEEDCTRTNKHQPVRRKQREIEYRHVEVHKPNSRRNLQSENASRLNLYERNNSFSSENSGVSPHQDSSRRRRQERNRLKPITFDPLKSNISHDIHPQPRDEEVVVTARFVYRPRHRQLSEVRKEDVYISKQEGIEPHNLGRQKSKYSRHSPTYPQDEQYDERLQHDGSEKRLLPHGRYAQNDSDLSGIQYPKSDSELRYKDDFGQHPPRAPSLPQSSSSSNPSEERTQQQAISPDSISYAGSEHASLPYRQYDQSRPRSRSRGRESVRSSSIHRQPHVREATDGGTERTFATSPSLHPPGEYVTEDSAEDSDVADARGIKRHQEQEKHVTFRVPSRSTSHEEEDLIIVEEERSVLEDEEDQRGDEHWAEHDGWGKDNGETGDWEKDNSGSGWGGATSGGRGGGGGDAW